MKVRSLVQIVILAQASTIIALGFALAWPFSDAYTSSVRFGLIFGRTGGMAGLVAVLIAAMPKLLPIIGTGVALFWWLSQQKQALGRLDQTSCVVLPRWRKFVLALVAVVILIAACAVPLFQRHQENQASRTPSPPSAEPSKLVPVVTLEPSVIEQRPCDDRRKTNCLVSLDDLDKELSRQSPTPKQSSQKSPDHSVPLEDLDKQSSAHPTTAPTNATPVRPTPR